MRERIGLGGSGVVHLATDLQNGGDVVVKLLSQHLLDDPESVARFDREARRLSEIRHPNVVSMFDYGHDEGRAFLVMDYIRGELLEKRLKATGCLSLADFVPIAAQLLKAVSHAHQHGMMIRDIKPSNIMLCNRHGRSNYLILLDFGLAKMLGESTTQITCDKVVGTLGFIAPEALIGAEVDLRVDVYSLGVVFFRMLCGKLPFTADSEAAILYLTVHGPTIDLANDLPDNHDIGPELVSLINSCLARDPDARPRDATAIVQQLIQCVPARLFHLPHAAPNSEQPPTPPPILDNNPFAAELSSERTPQRVRSKAGMMGVATFALVTFGVMGAFIHHRRGSEATADPELIELPSNSATRPNTGGIQVHSVETTRPSQPSSVASDAPHPSIQTRPIQPPSPAASEVSSSDRPPIGQKAKSGKTRSNRKPPDDSKRSTPPKPSKAALDQPGSDSGKGSVFLPARKSRTAPTPLLSPHDRD